jgi:hypothetical protein
MKAMRLFSPQNSLLKNASAAFFGALSADPLVWPVFGYAANWPRNLSRLTDHLGNYAAVATYKRKRCSKPTLRAKLISPAVDAVLDILVPALCQRDPRPFRLFATAIEAAAPTKSNDRNGYAVRSLDHYPAHPVHYYTLCLAIRISGRSKQGHLPISQSVLRRRVEKLSCLKIDPGYFHRVCKSLGLIFRKDPNAGGRPQKSG